MNEETERQLARIADALEGIQARLDKLTTRKRHVWQQSAVEGYWTCTRCGVNTLDTARADKKEPCI